MGGGGGEVRARGWAEAKELGQPFPFGTIHTCWCPHPPELCAAEGRSPRLTLGELGEETCHWPQEKNLLARGPGPVAARGFSFGPGLCFWLPPQGHHGTLLPPGSASQLLLPHIRDTYFQAGRIPPRMLYCGGLWAGEVRGGSVPAPGLQEPQELPYPTGCLSMSSESLTPTQAVSRKGRRIWGGEWTGSQLGQAGACCRGQQTHVGTNPAAHSG